MIKILGEIENNKLSVIETERFILLGCRSSDTVIGSVDFNHPHGDDVFEIG